MAQRKKKKPLYKKNCRFYADFRDSRDFGGGQEALTPDGEWYATHVDPIEVLRSE